MFLIKEAQHTGDNHGALWFDEEEYDEEGELIGSVKTFCGNVVTSDLEAYLRENPHIQVI